MGQTVNLLAYAFGGSTPSLPTLHEHQYFESSAKQCAQASKVKMLIAAGVTQLVESQPSKLLVAGSSPVSRSTMIRHFRYSCAYQFFV